MLIRSKLAIAISSIALLATSVAASADTMFWSTQARPAQEAQNMRDRVLAGAGQAVDFQPSEIGPWMTRLQAEVAANKGTIGVLGALHGNFTSLGDVLVDLSGIVSGDVNFQKLAMLGTSEQKYMPWMQATYIMAANKKALEFLPEGADINALTYDQLIAWSKNMAEKTGGPKFGFPAGPKGLKHRFFQGYLYPSYTNSVVRKFASAEAETAWNKFKELWQYTNPASTNFGFMQEQLLSDEVWVAFDHTARLADAFNQRPDDFVAFPAPSGPAGRGFMPVIAGVAIPKTAPDMDAARDLVAYLMKPETQIKTLKATSFFPVVDVELPDDLPAAVKISGAAVATMSASPDANPGMLPAGLGKQGGRFNQVYTDTFERIVLAGQPVRAVLDDQKKALEKIMNETGAPCWQPDEPSEGACPVE